MQIGFASILLVLSASGAAGQPLDPSVEVLELGQGAYRLTLRTSGTADVAAGQQLLFPTAERLCGNLTVAFGKYTFDTNEPVLKGTSTDKTTMVLTQEMSCAAAGASPPTSAGAASSAEWRQTEGDQAEAIRVFTEYLSAKDRGDYPQSYAMLSQSMRDTVSLDNWQGSPKQFNSLAGGFLSREIRRITWYKDPPSAPQSGVYVAIDFASKFRNVDIHCGYVVLYQVSKTTFEVIREETGFLDRETASKVPAAEIPELAKRLGCVPKASE